MSGRLPEWLADHLEKAAITVGGVGTNLTARVCRHCKAKTVVALTPERIATRFDLDPTPLSPLGELQAVLAGRATVATTRRDRKVEVNHRRAWHIATKPPGSFRGVVLAEHRCGSPPLAAAPPRPDDRRLPPNSPPPF